MEALLFHFTIPEPNTRIIAEGYRYNKHSNNRYGEDFSSNTGLNSITIAGSCIPTSRPKHDTSIHGRSFDERQDLGDKVLRLDVATTRGCIRGCRLPQKYFISFNFGLVIVPVVNEVGGGAAGVLAREVVVELDLNIVE